LSVSIIQAINRIRRRQVADTEGRGPSADIFIVLPRIETGDAILEDIRADIPDLNVVDGSSTWMVQGYERIDKGTVYEALITLMDNRLTGETYLVHSTRTCAVKKLQETLRDPEHRTTKALRQIGVEYVVQGAGRGAKGLPREARAALKQTAGTTSIHKASGARSVF
jgi:hypothetical protein